jgi:hypothetical protein
MHDEFKVAEYLPRWSSLEYMFYIMHEFDYARTLSCIWRYRVGFVLDSITRPPHKYERMVAIKTMMT